MILLAGEVVVGVGVGVLGREYFRCILILSQDRRVWGILLLYAVFTM